MKSRVHFNSGADYRLSSQLFPVCLSDLLLANITLNYMITYDYILVPNISIFIYPNIS